MPYNKGLRTLWKRFPAAALACLLPAGILARQQREVCGTHGETWREQLFLHQQSLRRLAAEGRLRTLAEGRQAARDVGNIATMDDSNGVAARPNVFDLDSRTLTFQPASPSATAYTFAVSGASYSTEEATQGTPLGGLGDDDTRTVNLPFAFNFFGVAYHAVSVNSDGNLTFGGGDTDYSARSLGRMVAGAPRIAPLFSDLDPSQSPNSVRVLTAADHVSVSWVAVRDFSETGTGNPHTFQVRLWADGRIEFAWSTASPVVSAVVGIAPGHAQGSTAVLSFAAGSTATFAATVAESFGITTSIDMIRVAQRFYETHDDAYDYLVVYNALGITAMTTAVAYESTVRNDRSGYGDTPVETGAEYGSGRRLQAVINMGPVTQYETDPLSHVALRGSTPDTPLSVIAHEMGHLFLAYASIPDPNNPSLLPMLNPLNNAHWGFNFNSDASFLEGNRIKDNGATFLPHFQTTGAVEHYSELDQYLMGFRAQEEVAPTFLVQNSSRNNGALPQVGVALSGERRDIAIDEIVAAAGRRTPDSTVAQRHFRAAVILITPAGSDPSPDTVAQLEGYRAALPAYYAAAASGRATMDTTLAQSLGLSLWPAAGVVAGSSATATVTLARPAAAALTVSLSSDNGNAQTPASVTIAAGQQTAAFNVQGVRAGVSEITAQIDGSYETAAVKVQVNAFGSDLAAVSVSGNYQLATAGVPLPEPIVLRVGDVNRVAYPGKRVNVSVSPGGNVDRTTAVSDEYGQVSVRWTPGANPLNELYATVEGSAQPALTVTALGPPAIFDSGVVNAASFQPGLTPNGLATIFGANLSAGFAGGSALTTNLAGIQVLVNGTPAQLFYATDRQINFWIPASLRTASAGVAVSTPLGVSATLQMPVQSEQPGIFYDVPSGYGAILIANTGLSTIQRPAHAGDYIEIYATGLGAVTVSSGLQTTVSQPSVNIGGQPAAVPFSGLAPGFVGLYQVNAQVPVGTAAGDVTVWLSINGRQSNSVKIKVQ